MNPAPRDGRERRASVARRDADMSFTGVLMALLLAAGAGALTFGVAWFGLRWAGCPVALVKGLAALAGLVAAVLVTLRLFGRGRRRDAWRDGGSGFGVVSGLCDVVDVSDVIDVLTD
jgi:hypothetical protein